MQDTKMGRNDNLQHICMSILHRKYQAFSRYLNRHWLFSLAFGCPDRGVSGKEPIHNSQSSISTNETVSPSRISNGLMGIVISTLVRLTRTTLRIRIGIRTDLRVRLADSPY